jgi:L-amino acid N-acyltransferase YncA
MTKIDYAKEEDIPDILRVQKYNQGLKNKGGKGHIVYSTPPEHLRELMSNQRNLVMVSRDSTGKVTGYAIGYDMNSWRKLKPEWEKSLKSRDPNLDKYLSEDKSFYVRQIALDEENKGGRTAGKLSARFFEEARKKGYEVAIGDIERAPNRNYTSENFFSGYGENGRNGEGLGFKRFARYRARGEEGEDRLWGVFRKDLKKKTLLEERLARTTAIISILGSLFFFSSNITGNAIADMTTKTTSFLGAGLLIVGLIAGFFWLKGRKPKHKK